MTDAKQTTDVVLNVTAVAGTQTIDLEIRGQDEALGYARDLEARGWNVTLREKWSGSDLLRHLVATIERVPLSTTAAGARPSGYFAATGDGSSWPATYIYERDIEHHDGPELTGRVWGVKLPDPTRGPKPEQPLEGWIASRDEGIVRCFASVIAAQNALLRHGEDPVRVRFKDEAPAWSWTHWGKPAS